jgi:hypothetical protein
VTRNWNQILFVFGLLVAISLIATILALVIGHIWGRSALLTLIGPLVGMMLVLSAKRFLLD